MSFSMSKFRQMVLFYYNYMKHKWCGPHNYDVQNFGRSTLAPQLNWSALVSGNWDVEPCDWLASIFPSNNLGINPLEFQLWDSVRSSASALYSRQPTQMANLSKEHILFCGHLKKQLCSQSPTNEKWTECIKFINPQAARWRNGNSFLRWQFVIKDQCCQKK